MAIKQTGIYGFVFPNRKEYWGQSINVGKRVRTHFSRSSKKDNIKYIVDNAIRKYGKENIQIYIFYCQEEYLDYAETEMIKRRNSICPSGYNLDSGGKVNRHPSIETKNKISSAQKGKPSKCGWHHTTETKAKLSSLLMGHKGFMLGKHHTAEARTKISDANKGKIFSTETREKLRITRLGKHPTLEARTKMSESKKGSHLALNVKLKISNSNKGKHNKFRKIVKSRKEN